MKTLFISAVSPDISTGGIERYIKNTMDYCRQNFIEAVFLLPASGQESTEIINNVLIIKKNFLYLNYKKVFNKREISRTELKKKSREFFEFLKILLQKEKITIIDAQELTSTMPPIYSLVLNMISFLQGIPLVLTMHSFVTTKLETSLVSDLQWEKIICASKSVAGDCLAKKIAIDRLHTEYLGVNTKEFTPQLDNKWLKKKLKISNDKKIILHASRLINFDQDIIKEKGIITLLESFSQVYSKNPNIKLVLALAAPPDSLKSEFYYAINKLKGYIQLHSLEEGVVIGKFKLEEMPLVYNGADVFVLVSENETFGQVYIEAMACGVPVIGTNVGGVPEIITDGQNGFLVEPNNPSILTQKLEELLHNNVLRNIFIINGFKSVKRKFSTDKQFRILFNYLNKLSGIVSKV